MIKHCKNLNEFNDIIKNNKTVCVDFFTTWCGPCKMLAPVIEQVDATNEYDVLFVKVDAEEATDLSMKFQISAVPTLFLIKEGKVVATKSGYMSELDLIRFITK